VSWYTNITLRGAAPKEAAKAAASAGMHAFIPMNLSDLTVVCDRECERPTAVLGPVAQKLSMELACPALEVLNFDDDCLAYLLFDRGRQLDEYNSGKLAGESRPGEDRSALWLWLKAWLFLPPRAFGLLQEKSDNRLSDSEAPSPPQGGDAQVLCRLFGLPGDVLEIERVLRSIGRTDFYNASDRHIALLRALGWPLAASPIDEPGPDPPYLHTFRSLRFASPPEGWLEVR